MRGVVAVVVTVAATFAVLAVIFRFGVDMYFRVAMRLEQKREKRTA